MHRIVTLTFLLLTLMWALAIVPQSPLLGPLLILSEPARSFPYLLLCLWIAVITISVLRWKKYPRQVAAFIIFIGCASTVYIARMWPFLVAPTDQPTIQTEMTTVTIAVVNVEFGRTSAERLRNVLPQQLPDILVVSEVTAEWLAQGGFLSEYQFKVEAPGGAAEGAAVFSRFPLEGIKELAPGFFKTFALTVRVRPTTPVHLISLHAPPPQSDPAFSFRALYFEAIDTYISSLPAAAPLVLAGDFNTTPLSDTYRTFTSRHNLRNIAHGRGFPATWPLRYAPWVGAYIDQVLYRGDAQGVGVQVLNSFGSDHRPLLATLQFFENARQNP